MDLLASHLKPQGYDSLNALVEKIIAEDLLQASTDKLSAVLGLPKSIIRALDADPNYRRALNTRLALSVLSVADQLEYYRQVRAVALSDTQFKEKEAAGRLLLGQAGLMEGEKREAPSTHTLNINFKIHAPEVESEESKPREDLWRPPDRLAGVKHATHGEAFDPEAS